MFQPKFQMSHRLVSELSQVERLYGQIESLKVPETLELNLTRQNLVQSSYASNKIEGNPLTLPEVTNLLLDDRVPVNRSEKEVVNYFDILKNLDTYMDRPCTTALITDIHAKLLEGVDQSAGKIRNIKVVVGRMRQEEGASTLRVKHDPPYHTAPEITAHLNELCDWEEKEKELPVLLRAGIFHHQFVYLHPFEDGNGRVCRILTAAVFLKGGYRINKYFILDDYYDIDRHLYSDMLHAADTGDKTQWLEYFAEGVKHSLKSAHFRLKNAAKTLEVKNRPSGKEREVLHLFEQQSQVTSPEVTALLQVTRQQAHNLLKSLASKGFIVKHGSTKSSYYVLK